MTRTMKKANALLALLLAAVFAVSTFAVSFAATAEPAAQQVLYIIQLIVGTADPEDVDGVYVVVPTDPDSPLPVNEDGEVQTRWTVTGNRYDKAYFNFTKAGSYEYTLAKLKEDSVEKKDSELTSDDFEEGTATRPLTHVFGFKVEAKSDGSWNVIPYTCEDPQIYVLPEGDDGYPTGMSIWNYVNAESAEPDEPVTEPEPVTKDDGEPVTVVSEVVKTTIVYVNNKSNVNANGNANSNSNGSSGTTKKSSNVNTGDPHQMILWVVLLGVAAVGLVVVFFIRRKQDDEDE